MDFKTQAEIKQLKDKIEQLEKRVEEMAQQVNKKPGRPKNNA